MQVIRGIESAQFSSVVLTIGNFDGVHLGHQAILASGRRRADAAGTQLVAMTFDPHPSALLTPDRITATLTPFDEKMRLLENAGADIVVIVETNQDFLHVTAQQFITDIIMARFNPIAIVEGATFGFGQHRKGDVDMLQTTAKTRGFEMEVVEPIRAALGGHPDTVISSSLVRHLLSSGTVDKAAVCLGRPYSLFGQVIRGVGRGQSLGFPTANLAVESQLIPAEGVYAGHAQVENQLYDAALSIGRIPTFDDLHELTTEAFLLDYSGDLYDKPIRFEFVEWIRDQEKFDSAQALSEQMTKDVTRTREILAASSANK